MLNDKKSEVLTVKLFISLALVAPNASEKNNDPKQSISLWLDKQVGPNYSYL